MSLETGEKTNSERQARENCQINKLLVSLLFYLTLFRPREIRSWTIVTSLEAGFCNFPDISNLELEEMENVQKFSDTTH